MTRKKRAGGGKKATIVLANEADDLKGALKHLGGSRSDDWNNILANQAINTLWLKHSDEETRDQQYDATLFALIGIGPRDELEGMIAAQLLAHTMLPWSATGERCSLSRHSRRAART